MHLWAREAHWPRSLRPQWETEYFLPYQEKRTSQSSAITALRKLRKEIPAIQQPSDYNHSGPEAFQERKLRVWKPGSYLRCIWKKGFHWAQTLLFSHTQKTRNSLTWDIWFSLINNNLLMFRQPVLCCKTGSSPDLLSSSLRVTWHAASQA